MERGASLERVPSSELQPMMRRAIRPDPRARTDMR